MQIYIEFCEEICATKPAQIQGTYLLFVSGMLGLKSAERITERDNFLISWWPMLSARPGSVQAAAHEANAAAIVNPRR